MADDNLRDLSTTPEMRRGYETDLADDRDDERRFFRRHVMATLTTFAFIALLLWAHGVLG
jgi:hypothetical protein